MRMLTVFVGPAGTVDGPIGRFLLPIGGGSAEATWTLPFSNPL